MGRFLANARDGAGARVFTLDGRPVVFIFGSHTWGLLPLESAQFTAFEVALDRAREAFRVRYGSLPFLVGEEKILSAGGVFADDRVRHMASFDAAYVYHHASLKPLSVAPGLGGTFGITPRYVEHQIAILQHNFRAVQDIRKPVHGQSRASHSEPVTGLREAGVTDTHHGTGRVRRLHEDHASGASRSARAEPMAGHRRDHPLAGSGLHRRLLERGVRGKAVSWINGLALQFCCRSL